MSVAVTHGRTATSVAARRAPPPKKHGERPNLRPRTADLYRLLPADQVGRRLVGNIRALPGGGYRLRFGRQGTTRLSPKVYGQYVTGRVPGL
jgi:hypothetical protein